MKVVPRSRQEILVQVFRSGRSSGELFFHDGNQFTVDFVNLIPSKQIGYFAGREHVVDVLKKSLVFDFIVGEDEGDSLALYTGHTVENLQVV